MADYRLKLQELIEQLDKRGGRYVSLWNWRAWRPVKQRICSFGDWHIASFSGGRRRRRTARLAVVGYSIGMPNVETNDGAVPGYAALADAIGTALLPQSNLVLPAVRRGGWTVKAPDGRVE